MQAIDAAAAEVLFFCQDVFVYIHFLLQSLQSLICQKFTEKAVILNYLSQTLPLRFEISDFVKNFKAPLHFLRLKCF